MCQSLDVMEKYAQKNDVVGHINAIAEYAAVSTMAKKNPFLIEMVNQLWPMTMRFQFASIPLRENDIGRMTTLYRDTYHNLKRGDTESTAAVVTINYYGFGMMQKPVKDGRGECRWVTTLLTPTAT